MPGALPLSDTARPAAFSNKRWPGSPGARLERGRRRSPRRLLLRKPRTHGPEPARPPPAFLGGERPSPEGVRASVRPSEHPSQAGP